MIADQEAFAPEQGGPHGLEVIEVEPPRADRLDSDPAFHLLRRVVRGAQQPGEARDIMIAAMREVLLLAAAEGVNLGEEDIDYWLSVIAPLNPAGKPSMRQDTEAKRKTEVELFSGTVLELSRKHGIPAPVNEMLNIRIRAMEDGYLDK